MAHSLVLELVPAVMSSEVLLSMFGGAFLPHGPKAALRARARYSESFHFGTVAQREKVNGLLERCTSVFHIICRIAHVRG